MLKNAINAMDNLTKIANRIVEEQEQVIGPLAWREAGKVQGLTVPQNGHSRVEINAPDGRQVIDRLVAQYEHLFGRASSEVCREAVAGLLLGMPSTEIPASLR